MTDPIPTTRPEADAPADAAVAAQTVQLEPVEAEPVEAEPSDAEPVELEPGVTQGVENSPTALYRAALGPLNVNSYVQVFGRFDADGRRGLVWHPAAAAFTLGWLVLRRLWAETVAYVLLLGLGLLAGWGLWQSAWPLGVRYGLWVTLLLVWVLLPGWGAYAWLHRQVQRRILRAVAQAPSLAHAQDLLQTGAVDRARLRQMTQVFAFIYPAMLLAGAVGLWASGQQAQGPEPVASVAVLPPQPPPAGVMSDALPSQPSRATAGATADVPPAPPVAQDGEVDAEPAMTRTNSDTVTLTAPSSVTPPVADRVPAPGPSPRSSSPASPAGSPRFGVNVGLFADPANAQRAHQRLLQAGLPATLETLRGPQGERHRVRVGPFDDEAAAQRAAQRVRAQSLDALVYSVPR